MGHLWRNLTGLALAVSLAAPTALAEDPPPGEETLALFFDGGGGLGQVTTLSLTGTPLHTYWVVMSLNEGPFPLPPGWTPSELCVGTDLLSISASVPGFLGNLGPTGSISLPLPFPSDGFLAGLLIYFQAIDIPPSGAPSVGASNQYRVTLQEPGTFSLTAGSAMTAPRSGHTATLLDDGTVFCSGGGEDVVADPGGQPTTEIYHPDKEAFVAVANLMTDGRTWHTATKLLDGRVLLTGGGTPANGDPTASAEVFDPVSGTFTAVSNLMSEARALHAASLLPDGRVLVSGGTDNLAGFDVITNSLKTTDIYDPVTNSFSPGPDLAEPKVGHTSTTLASGDVLVAAGYTFDLVFGFPVPSVSNKAQVFSGGSFGSELDMTEERFGHAATLLPDGRVFISGGAGGDPFLPSPVSSTEVYDPGAGFFSSTASMNFARGTHQSTVLPDGSVLVEGGAVGTLTSPEPVGTAEVWDPITDAFNQVSDLVVPRLYHRSVLLPDGTVLIMGGSSGAEPVPIDSAEIYQPF